MEIDQVSKKSSKKRFFNKYQAYRQEIKKSKNFSVSLQQTEQSQSTQKATAAQTSKESQKLAKEQNAAEKAALNPASSTTETTKLAGSHNISVKLHQVNPEVRARMLRKAKPFEKEIKAAAARYNLPEELIVGFMYQESRMNPKARSHAGAMGLMQLMPGTAKYLGVANAWDPAQNIDGGAKYIRQMFDKFGRLDHAAAAYNAGPGNVRKYGGIPPFRETQDYVPKVLGYATAFAQNGGFKVQADTQLAANAMPTNAVRA